MKKKKRVKYLYGKFHYDTYEFRKSLHDLFSDFLKKYPKLDTCLHNDLIELRNKIIALLNSWIGTKKIEAKFGIKILPISVHPSIKVFLEKQSSSYYKKYRPCEICGEDRITHFCHIIPRSEGGPSDERNYLYFCPMHHHLFDHRRLNKDEWNKINFSEKLKSSQEYAQKIILPVLENFWVNKK
jgi:hypothetical protein